MHVSARSLSFVLRNPAARRRLTISPLDAVAVTAESFIETVEQASGNGNGPQIGFYKDDLIFVRNDTDDDFCFAFGSFAAQISQLPYG